MEPYNKNRFIRFPLVDSCLFFAIGPLFVLHIGLHEIFTFMPFLALITFPLHLL